jgi:hypothetical protein
MVLQHCQTLGDADVQQFCRRFVRYVSIVLNEDEDDNGFVMHQMMLI